MNPVEETVRADLFAMQDPGYRNFHSRLMPTVDKQRIIGVRVPALRRYAAGFAKTAGAAEYLSLLPHHYYEENNLHAFLIERLGDFDRTVAAVDAFLPYVDNWATCDSMSPKVFGRHRPELLPHIERWMSWEHPYAVRYGIGMLQRYFLGDAFGPEYLDRVARACGSEYYVNMMVAWYFATALARQYKAACPYLSEHRLPPWVHEKTIRKALESDRLMPEQKAELRTFR